MGIWLHKVCLPEKLCARHHSFSGWAGEPTPQPNIWSASGLWVWCLLNFKQIPENCLCWIYLHPQCNISAMLGLAFKKYSYQDMFFGTSEAVRAYLSEHLWPDLLSKNVTVEGSKSAPASLHCTICTKQEFTCFFPLFCLSFSNSYFCSICLHILILILMAQSSLTWYTESAQCSGR